MLAQGEKEKAVAITDKYFEGFPNMNFPYDARTLPHINIYIGAGELEKAKYHMRILAKESAEWMEFFDSLDQDDLRAGFSLDARLTNNAVSEVLRISKTLDDPDFAAEMEALLGPYAADQMLE